MQTPHMMSGGRYPALRSFAILYVFGAALAVIGGIIGIIYTMARAPYVLGDRLIISLGILGATCLAVLTMMAFAEVLKLVIDIEHNTRTAAVGKVSGEMMAAATASGAGVSERRTNRFDTLNEETAEAALLRGH